MSKVGIIKTTPHNIIEDYSKLLDLVDYQFIIKRELKTIIKINLSWTLFYPACSTPPWQLDGVLSKLIDDGVRREDIIPTENQTVVTHPWDGFFRNKLLNVLKKHNTQFRPLTNENWVKYDPKSDVPWMRELFKDNIIIPEVFQNSNIIHLPTLKTHGHTTTTGAIKNAFGGLIPKYRHHSHRIIDGILVDLLVIQKELHPGMLAVMDGTVAGDGAGPRVMEPVYTNLLLASEDQVAIDALSAKIMGFDPLNIEYIRMAHDQGLGMGDVDQIDIVGLDSNEVREMNLNFTVKRSLVVKWDQRLRNTTYRYRPLKPFHWLFFHTPLFRLLIAGSSIYHDWFWYRFIGKRKIKKFLETNWGKLYDSYEFGEKEKYPKIKDWNPY
ncbi:MAG: DUF362 domain-containing protein [Candidatus Thorarchaeota archaeon]